MLKKRAGVPGPGLLTELSHSQVSLEHHWFTAAVALVLVFKDDYAILHLWGFLIFDNGRSLNPFLAAQIQFWLTDPIPLGLLHPLQLVLSHLWLFL